MKAIILSAGQGRRLLPLTEKRPKCLIPLAGRSLLEWQLRNLAAAGLGEAVVVTGFGADPVESALRVMQVPGLAVRTLHNPFFAVADNLGSCWAARSEMDGEFLVLNGDTLFEVEIAERLIDHVPTAPITVTVDRKEVYDADDMKVQTEGAQLVAIGKTLDPARVDGESIGFLRFTAEGGRAFRDAVEAAMRRPEGLKQWYLSVIDALARTAGQVGVMSIEGLSWGEMDFPADVKRNEKMTFAWLRDADPGRAAEAG
ncbi:MAG TPA: phosphocholine cytidylyltransferase family protein [Caulobacteraceae bacterium]|jgi:choline kinase|nr:phosphocholine cytidylyltransferase family protein [Caulobacteraceae bacterium]